MSDGAWQLLIVLTTVGLAVQAIVMVGILRQVGSILLQMGPAIPGEVAEGPELGMVVDTTVVPRGKPAIVLFVSPVCELCKPIVAALPTLRRHHRALTFVPVVTGDDTARRDRYAQKIFGARTDLNHVYEDWEIPGTPFAVAIGAQGRIRSRAVVNNLPQLETLAGALLAPHMHDEVAGSAVIQIEMNAEESPDRQGVDAI
jgi:hypothetical protein